MAGGNLDLVIDSLEEPFLLINKQSVIERANNAAQDVLGKNLIGLALVRVLRHPEALRCVDAVRSDGQTVTTEVELSTPHLTTYRLTVLALDNGASLALILKDVSPLLRAAQMRSDFVANVSHELRSPLTTLSGLIETLQGPAKDDPQAQERFLSIMEREAGRMDRLIADLLSLSRVEEDEKIRPREHVDLTQLIRSVITSIKERDDKDPHKMVFDVDGQALVPGDSDQLIQVLQNLLENAIKYSKPDGEISVLLDHQNDYPGFEVPVWRVQVADQGDGILPEHLPRLTERFYRVDSGRSREMGGTGLGLAIVKHIVSRHRGRLSIKSQPGSGTQVTVVLPAIENV